jgi:threonine aldolase
MGGGQVVDLRSDTVTRPTQAMREAMAECEVGDDGYGDDPTVARLERLAAGMLGKEAAIFLPSGTMANLIAQLALVGHAGAVFGGERSHLFLHERGAGSIFAGQVMLPVREAKGALDPVALRAALAGDGPRRFGQTMVSLETSHNDAGGRPLRIREIEAVAAVCREQGTAMHLDGARLFNAAVALDVVPERLCRPFDTVSISLSKGLSAPAGSLLAGTSRTVAAARDWRKLLGGQMRQVGILAACGIVALETMVERLRDDHAVARRLASALADRFQGVVGDAPETNIVMFDTSPSGKDTRWWRDRLRETGVLATMADTRRLRLVVHRHIDDATADMAVALIGSVWERARLENSRS